MNFSDVAKIGAGLPEVEEGTSYGTPALKVRGRMLVRLRGEDGLLVVPMPADERDMMIEAEPKVYSTTDHYRGHDLVLVNLDAIEREKLMELIERAWRAKASKKAIAEHDLRQSGQ